MSDQIAVGLLRSHPENCNKMSPREFVKLKGHIERFGDYPPVIVRGHPSTPGEFEILDGHYRVHILRELGRETVTCEVWDADDDRARVLLLTLNRLNGVDDPHKRGALLERMARSMTLADLAKVVPDDRARIQRLIALNKPPEALQAAVDEQVMPEAVTFFLLPQQKSRLYKKLAEVDRDRSKALVVVLGLGENVHVSGEVDTTLVDVVRAGQ